MKLFDAYRVKWQEKNGHGAPGTIRTDERGHLEVACGTDTLRIYELQLAGKKRMQVKDFLLGFRDIDEWHFVSI